MTTVTAGIASHPARWTNGKLRRALDSVLAQTRQPDAIIVANDRDRRGAGWSRQSILDQAETEWIAWLDSDDEWYPQHLEKLLKVAEATGAVFVFPWFDAVGARDPLGHFGLPFNPATPHHTTTTYLVRTELAQHIGYTQELTTNQWSNNEDWIHLLGLCEIAVQNNLLMLHLAERTWRYNIDGDNSSGKPGQGDAQ